MKPPRFESDNYDPHAIHDGSQFEFDQLRAKELPKIKRDIPLNYQFEISYPLTRNDIYYNGATQVRNKIPEQLRLVHSNIINVRFSTISLAQLLNASV